MKESGPSGSPNSYTIDETNNWTSVTGAVAGAGAYTRSASDPPKDWHVNQYTTTPGVSSRTYDDNGNVVEVERTSETLLHVYNYRNQMTQWFEVDNSTEDVIASAEYGYDALGRRVVKEDSTGDATMFVYDGWRVIEEVDVATDTVDASYTWGRYIDEPLTMKRDGAEYYYFCDDMHNVVRVTDASGDVVEAYEYDDYGTPTYYDSSGVKSSQATSIGNTYLFTGRQFDAETGYYYYRYRYLDPSIGRFTTRDPLGMWGDMQNVGNGYAYVGNNPHTWVDPRGLEGEKKRSFSGSVFDWLTGFENGPRDQASDLDERFVEPQRDNSQAWSDLGVGTLAGDSGRGFDSVEEGYNEALDNVGAIADEELKWGACGAAIKGIIGGLKGLKRYLWASESATEGVEDLRHSAKACDTCPSRFGGKGGGSYDDVRRTNVGGEAHHIPPDSVSPWSKGKEPAIIMDVEDHRNTASWGSSRSAIEHRQIQSELINRGHIREAMQMDIDDIRSKFGNKYDTEIKEMIDYFEQNHGM